MSKKVAVIMAAGKGTRMKSELPKVLIPVCGRPMIEYVVETLTKAEVDEIIIVVGYRADDVRAQLHGRPKIKFAVQAEQLGTGHAVMMCRDYLLDHHGPVLVVAGDSPLMQVESIRSLFTEFERSQPACILGTGYREDPTGLGRVVRDADRNFSAIVEEKDASPEIKKIREVNLSCYVFNAPDLLSALDKIRADNAQKEYYLTDCPSVLKAAGKDVRALDVLKPVEALSINTMAELAVVEDVLRQSSATPGAKD